MCAFYFAQQTPCAVTRPNQCERINRCLVGRELLLLYHLRAGLRGLGDISRNPSSTSALIFPTRDLPHLA